MHDLLLNATEWAVLGIVSFVGGCVVNYLGQIKDSIIKLNENVAVILTTISEHDRRIEKLEERDTR